MRYIILLIIAGCCIHVVAQSDDIPKSNEVSAYIGLGAFPQGLSSIPVVSGQYLTEGNPYISIVLGADFLSKKHNVGFFVESSLSQNFRSNEWIPFWPAETDHEEFNKTIISYSTEANGFNFGCLVGGEISPKFELTAKLGAGLTYHSYSLVYETFLGGRQLAEGKEAVLNYQFAMQTKYYVFTKGGFMSSVAISKGNPVFTLGIVGMIGL